MIIEVVTRELPAWTMFLLVTGTRILFAVTAPPLFLATTQIAYWICKLNSITSKTNSNIKRRQSKNKTEGYKETKMILSCVMLSNWFCHMHIKVDFDLLLDSIAMQTAFNFSSHVFKTAYEVWLPPPKEPPDGYITCFLICLVMQGKYLSLFIQGLWKIFKIVRATNDETTKEKPANRQRILGCYSTWKILKTVVEAFSGEMTTK